MLRVNLNMLLAERNLTASRLSKETGISKTTLTSLVNNTGKGIQYDTIDTICNFLGVTPNDFFDYVPVNYELSLVTEGVSLDVETDSHYETYIDRINYDFDFYIDIKRNDYKRTFELVGKLLFYSESQLRITVDFSKKEDYKEFAEMFYDSITAGHRTLFDKEVQQFIKMRFANDLNDLQPDLLNENYYSEYIKKLDPIIDLKWELPF